MFFVPPFSCDLERPRPREYAESTQSVALSFLVPFRVPGEIKYLGPIYLGHHICYMPRIFNLAGRQWCWAHRQCVESTPARLYVDRGQRKLLTMSGTWGVAFAKLDQKTKKHVAKKQLCEIPRGNRRRSDRKYLDAGQFLAKTAIQDLGWGASGSRVVFWCVYWIASFCIGFLIVSKNLVERRSMKLIGMRSTFS